jgi:hypothetical protein
LSEKEEICRDILKKLEETGQVYIVDHDVPLSISKYLFSLLDQRRRAEAAKLGVPEKQYEFEDVLWKLLTVGRWGSGSDWMKSETESYMSGLVLKMPVRLYCPKCGYEKIVTRWIEAASITDTSYRLARQSRELECIKCGAPILSEPCILYPRGWEVLKSITEEK